MGSLRRALLSISSLGYGFLGVACGEPSSPATEVSTNGPVNTSGMGVTGASTTGASTSGAGTTGAGTTGAGTTQGVQSTVAGATNASTSASGTVSTTTGAATSTASATSTGATGVGGGMGTATSDGSSSTTGAPPEPEPTLITSGQGNYWVVGEVTESAGGGAATITVNQDEALQDWIGFGGTFNEAGWDALKEVSAEDRDRALRLLFDKNDGIGFTHGRVPVGSSDYGLDRYSLAETPNDYTMEHFSIDRDRQDLIPYIHAALEVNPNIKFWASPWSPPPWMKDNNAFDRGNMKSDDQTLAAHALYLARFVEEYAAEGIVIEAIHPQNEPGYAQDYPSCLWSGSLMADYIANHLGPLFAERLPDTQVWLGTMSNPNDSNIVSAVMGNATARGFVKGIALQWGMGDGNLPSQYASQYQIPIMQSEHKCGNYPWEGGNANLAPNDHAYAEESWGFFKNWIGKNVNAYMAWNMVLDTVGRNLDNVRPWAQNALLAVDRATGELKITPTYYLFRHLGQYVEPGAVRVATQGGDVLAFKNPDGSIVAVVHNQGQQAADTTLAVAGTTLQFSVPARGWATVNWQG